jgi:predicted DsbA family dithiol-disulfide isomerase
MKVEIWSDVACPWCYIGKRRIETALDQFEQRDQVEVIWRSYQLDPQAPRISDKTVNAILSQKYGMSEQQAVAANQRVSSLAAAEGLEYRMDKARYGNSFDAHRLIHLAAAHQLQDAMEERFFKAYFTEGLALGEAETLVKLATEIGLNEDEVRGVLASDAYANEVRADIQRARRLGIQGVPFFAIDEKYGVSGAQPAEVLKEVLEQAWHEAHPLIQVSSTSQDAGFCDDDSCSIS